MNPKVDEYIENLALDWQRQVVQELRRLAHKADAGIQETLKRDTPLFEHDGFVVWVFCATDWVHISFPQGALLDSNHNLFEPTTNKAKRTIKLKQHDKFPSKIIVQLIRQAVKNNISGNKIVFTRDAQEPIILLDDVSAELKAYGLEEAYQERTYYQRKGYMQWIAQAKHDETRVKRINKMIEELQEGSYMPPKNKKGE